MSKHCYHGSQFPCILIFLGLLFFIRSERTLWLVFRWITVSCDTFREACMVHHAKYYSLNLSRTIFVVFSRSLHKWKTIHITYIRDSVWSEQIKTTYALFEFFADDSCVLFLFSCKIYGVSYFFVSVWVTLNNAINWRTASSFSMCIVFANSVYLYIESICW